MWVVKLDVCLANPPEEAGALCVWLSTSSNCTGALSLYIPAGLELGGIRKKCTWGSSSTATCWQVSCASHWSCQKELERGCWTERVRKYQMQWLEKEWLFLTFVKWWVCLHAWKQGFEWKRSDSGPLCLERGLRVCNTGDCEVRGNLWDLFQLYSSIWYQMTPFEGLHYSSQTFRIHTQVSSSLKISL